MLSNPYDGNISSRVLYISLASFSLVLFVFLFVNARRTTFKLKLWMWLFAFTVGGKKNSENRKAKQLSTKQVGAHNPDICSKLYLLLVLH